MPKNLQELRCAIETLVKGNGEILSGYSDDQAMSAEHGATFDGNQALIDKHQSEIRNIEASNRRLSETRLSATTKQVSRKLGRPRIGGSYEQLFGTPQSSQFESLGQFLSLISAGGSDSRLETLAAHGESSGQLGGFMAPEEYSSAMLDAANELEIVRPRATVEPMLSETKRIAGFENNDHSGNAVYGGFAGAWLGESETGEDQTGKLRMLKLQARKLAVFARASNEILADGVDFESSLAEAMIRAIAWSLDLAFLTGDGIGKPRGVLNDPALVTVPKESGQSAATIAYENLANMLSRLHPASYNDSVWVCNATAIPQLLLLTVPIGTGGSHIPVLEQNDIAFTMLTRPVIFTEKLPALGTKGDIMLCDFSQYTVGLRSELGIERSNAPGWHEDESSWRAIVRADGTGRWAKPFTPLNGNTQSWCVALADRS